MKNNPFVVFVAAFAVVLGSGWAFAAMDGPRGAVDNGLESSSFLADFGGDIDRHDAKDEPSTSEPQPDVISDPGEKTEIPTIESDERKIEEPKVDEPEVEGSKDSPVETAEAEKKEHADTDTWIEVLAPHDGQLFEDKTVVFEGKAEPGAAVYAGRYQADVSEDGGWRIVLLLSPGAQTVEFKALDPAGNRAFASVSVSLATPKVEEKPKVREFTVHQKFVESREPYEKFYGTGTPGMGIVARSEFGSADARVGENGEWWLPIEFSGLKETTTFPITVSTSAGFTGTYWFTYVAKVHEFTVHQKFVESREPYEKFYGTGTPGMGIVARSEFGSADARVGENGEWWLPIEFSGLKETTTFPITVSTTAGFTGTYWFTYVAKVHEFKANQEFGSCAEDPAYDVFFGSGVPGSVVEVGSAYGSGRVEVGEGGWWEVKVFFETAPIGETFDVSVGDSLGHTTGFSFTRLEGDAH